MTRPAGWAIVGLTDEQKAELAALKRRRRVVLARAGVAMPHERGPLEDEARKLTLERALVIGRTERREDR